MNAVALSWKKFESPSQERPYGLMRETSERLSIDTVKRLFAIARENIGNEEGRWAASTSGQAWGFANEGDRAYFVMLTAGQTDAL